MTRYSKAITALVGAIVAAAGLGLLPSPYDKWVPVLVYFVTALGVYQIPNVTPKKTAARKKV